MEAGTGCAGAGTDGDGRAFDHYNGWALHLYPVLDAHLGGDTGQAARYEERCARTSKASRGVKQGRRSAALRPFVVPVRRRCRRGPARSPGTIRQLTPGTSRRLASGGLRYFMERGALTDDGLLSLGWHGPHEATPQSYSGPASPTGRRRRSCPSSPPPATAVDGREEAAPVEKADRVPGPARAGRCWRRRRAATDRAAAQSRQRTVSRPHEGESAARTTRTIGRQTSTPPVPAPRRPGTSPTTTCRWRVNGRRGVQRRIHPLGAGHGDGWGWAAIASTGPPSPAGPRWCRGCGWRA
ncbi:DUF2264 domain-containing protein [Streptomyces thinghirensis]|nr:DUF2264 domain-containing protein [Streptomyces thinghirensis]